MEETCWVTDDWAGPSALGCVLGLEPGAWPQAGMRPGLRPFVTACKSIYCIRSFLKDERDPKDERDVSARRHLPGSLHPPGRAVLREETGVACSRGGARNARWGTGSTGADNGIAEGLHPLGWAVLREYTFIKGCANLTAGVGRKTILGRRSSTALPDETGLRCSTPGYCLATLRVGQTAARQQLAQGVS
jgi:hypothetical protein